MSPIHRDRPARLVLIACLVAVFQQLGCGSVYVGTLVVTGDLTMTQPVIGQVEIAADGLTLDCANYVIVDGGAAPACRGGTRSCGIQVVGRTNVTIVNCDVYGYDDGFWISDSSNIHVESSLATLNEVGFYIEDSDLVDIVRTTALSNLGEGFAVRRSDDTFFWESAAIQNERDGFDENDGSSAYYLRNDSYNNGVNGFELDFGPDPTYWENWVFANGQHGISLDAIANAEVHGNEIDVNGEDGLRLDDEGGVGSVNGLVELNDVCGNGRWEMHQCGSICTGNVFLNNIYCGPLNNIP